MTVKTVAPILLGAAVLAMVPACDVNSPERFIRAPIIRSFSPENPSFDVLMGDTVTFSVTAIDPEDGPLSFDFTLGDSVVTGGDTWSYVVNDTGSVEVAGRVFNRASRAQVTWTLQRTKPENLPPILVDFQPPDLNPSTRVGDFVAFSIEATDPEKMPLSYIFTVDDSVVSGSNQYLYPASDIGVVLVKGIVSDGETFLTNEWALTVLGEPDSIPPAPVPLLSLETGVETGELVARWVAVGDDSLEGLPSVYVVRTSPVPILTEVAWEQASDRPGEPTPATPGQIQQMVIGFLPPADDVYVAVRAVDDFGNFSPLANSLSAFVKGNDVRGVVRDAVTGAPVAGIRVRLTDDEATTDANGAYELNALPNGAATVRLRDEDIPGDFGQYFDIVTDDYVIRDEDTVDYWLLPNIPIQSTLYTSFLDLANRMTNDGGLFARVVKNWDEPIPIHIIPVVLNGLDYEPAIRRGFAEWEDLSGVDLFTFVDSIPPVGIYVTYSDIIERDNFRTRQVDSQQLPILGEIVMRMVYDPDSEDLLETIAGHEVGHALGFEHSIDVIHLMIGSRTAVVSEPSSDEILLIRAIYNMPRGQSMAWYLYD